MSHPSPLALDAFFLGEPAQAVAAHVSGCARCGDYVARLSAQAPLPAWLPRARVPAPRAGAWWGAPVAALTACLLAVWFTAPSQGVRAKGEPAVAVYARRGDRVAPWDGRSRLRAGDFVRLEVSPGARPWVAVLSPGAPPLYRGRVAAGESGLLPLSFQLDGSPENERVVVVFSEAELSDAALRAAAVGLPRTRAIWTVQLSLPKESP